MKRCYLLVVALLLAVGCTSQPVRGSGSLAIGADLRAISAASDVIVVGTVVEARGTRNLARLVSDPAKEASDIVVLGQDFTVRTDEVLKGSIEPSKQIVVSLARWHGVPGQTAGTDPGYVPFTLGARYVLFLKAINDGTGAYGQSLEPFRFVIDQGSARPESRWDGAEGRFPSRPSATFLADIRASLK